MNTETGYVDVATAAEHTEVDCTCAECTQRNPQTLNAIRDTAQRCGGTLDETTPPQITIYLRYTMHRERVDADDWQSVRHSTDEELATQATFFEQMEPEAAADIQRNGTLLDFFRLIRDAGITRHDTAKPRNYVADDECPCAECDAFQAQHHVRPIHVRRVESEPSTDR